MCKAKISIVAAKNVSFIHHIITFLFKAVVAPSTLGV